MSDRELSEIRNEMRIEWDAPIETDGGIMLRADVFRPVADGPWPVILSYGPYGKWLNFEDGYNTARDRLAGQHPDVPAGSTDKHQCWKAVGPEKWVPDCYACVRVHSRGCGRSSGLVEPWSPRVGGSRDNFVLLPVIPAR